MQADDAGGSWWADAQELTNSFGSTLMAAAGASPGGLFSPSHIDALFRQAHTLKGLYQMLGYGPLVELSHAMEEALSKLRQGHQLQDAPPLQLLLSGVEALASGSARANAQVALDEAALKLLIQRFAAASWVQPEAPGRPGASEVGGAAANAPPPNAPALSSSPNGLSELETQRLQAALAQHQRVVRLRAQWPLVSLEDGFLAAEQMLSAHGEVLAQSMQPSADDDEAALRCDFYLALGAAGASPESLSERLARVGAKAVSWEMVSQAPVGPARLPPIPHSALPKGPERLGAAEMVPASDPGAGATALGTMPVGPSSSLAATGGGLAQTVRVDIRRVDRLLHNVDELTNTKLAMEELSAKLASSPATASASVALLRESEALERRLTSLQQGLMQVRMVAVGQLFERLVRAGQQAAHELGKEVRFVVQGDATELDKFIAEKLVDPLLHLVRNAVDHGIERPADRRTCGKPAHGTVQLMARTRGGQVVVQVTDDGAGVDVAAVRAAAVQRGVCTPASAAALEGPEVLMLLCRPGFTTRDEVSAYSGRGVGLDVAKTELELLGGTIEVMSQAGAGTTVALVTPVTLAIVPALLVAAAGETYALPLAHVQEAVAYEQADSFASHGQEFLQVAGRVMPLVDVASQFATSRGPSATSVGVPLGPVSEPTVSMAQGLGEAASEAHALDEQPLRFVVVVGVGQKRLAVMVDDLISQRDLVVKSLGPRLTHVRSFAGAAELGGGKLTLVLNTVSMLHDAERGQAAPQPAERTGALGRGP